MLSAISQEADKGTFKWVKHITSMLVLEMQV